MKATLYGSHLFKSTWTFIIDPTTFSARHDYIVDVDVVSKHVDIVAIDPDAPEKLAHPVLRSIRRIIGGDYAACVFEFYRVVEREDGQRFPAFDLAVNWHAVAGVASTQDACGVFAATYDPCAPGKGWQIAGPDWVDPAATIFGGIEGISAETVFAALKPNLR